VGGKYFGNAPISGIIILHKTPSILCVCVCVCVYSLEHVTRDGWSIERDWMLMPRQKENFHHLLDFNKRKGVVSLLLGFVSSTIIKPKGKGGLFLYI
jgi:hypothetical protein